MTELEKKIAGDWYDLRQSLDDRFKSEELLDLDEIGLGELVQGLRLSVERGTVELKRKTLNGILAFVDSQQFDARSFRDISSHVRELQKSIYLVILQRSYCLGSLAPKKAASSSEPSTVEDAVRQMEVNAIIAKIQERVAKDPNLRNAPPVKNILFQVDRYRRELQNMKELAPNIPKEKSAAFRSNFKATFDEISRKIQENYVALLREEQVDEKPVVRKSMFLRFDLRPLGPFFATQAQELSRIRSILAFAEKERFKTREILSGILSRRDSSVTLIERELKEYERIWFGHGDELAREFAAEIAEHLGRKSSPGTEDEEQWV